MHYLCLTIITYFFIIVTFGEQIEFYPSKALVSNYDSRRLEKTKNVTYERRFIWSGYRPAQSVHDPTNLVYNKIPKKRRVDGVFHGKPKTREELWREHFLSENNVFDQTPSLIKLLYNITLTHLNDCTPVILYDSQIKSSESYLLQSLLKNFPVLYSHGYIDDGDRLMEPNLVTPNNKCLHFILFLSDVTKVSKVLGKRSESKVIVVARSSQWAVQEFLSSPLSRMFVNLLVIGQSFKDDSDNTMEAPHILYTHELYIDGLGASKPVVLNSWSHGRYSRDVNLFPPKMLKGYAGHRFIITAANQPPFVIRRVKTDLDGGNPRVTWDGVEIRLLHILAEKNNFSIEIVESKDKHLGSGDVVIMDIIMGRADIAAAGIYATNERILNIDLSLSHSQDCAVFFTLTSTALPRYRAILGPFRWDVWIALTFTYLIAIFPLAFSDKLTLRHLINNSGEIQNMFWYVFGTFTNCFTFVGKNSWSKTTKITTRLLIGWYWVFTIIITSCYTGSIIAFVTLPIFPETVDTIQQLLSGFYRVGTLDRGGWERWFYNSSDPNTNKLLTKLEFVPNVEAGIRNITKAFFWPYAFLGSQAELEYYLRSNYTETKSKRAVLHISNKCFVPFGVTLGFPRNSVYTAKLSGDIQRLVQSGILNKISDEVRWEVQRTLSGKVLAAVKKSLKETTVEEKGLTLEDTQGMFLLLGAGFLIAAAALVSEWMGGCSRSCRFKRKSLSGADRRENLISSPDSVENSKDGIGREMPFNTSPSSQYQDIVECEEIYVMEESGIVYEEYIIERSATSSIELDTEVQEIFERDLRRRDTPKRMDQNENKRQTTVSDDEDIDIVKRFNT